MQAPFSMMGYERRAAVVASFRVGKKPAEVIALYGFKRTMVTEIWSKWKTGENKDELSDKKAHNVRSSEESVTMMEARATLRLLLTRAVTSQRTAKRSRTWVTPLTVGLTACSSRMPSRSRGRSRRRLRSTSSSTSPPGCSGSSRIKRILAGPGD